MPSTNQVITPTTAGGTFVLDAQNYYRVTFIAAGLAGAETVAATVVISDTVSVPALDENGVAAIATATKPMIVLVGGPAYLLTQSATVGSSSTYVAPCSNN